ncbi:DUF4260 domain-containing protein [Marivita hallyeonensis]|uniref:DUF4260 domain-containing protein n=1 Tax=Marivita hallyeonensis TaxID=996342 RepID=A0A1M5X4Q3_9RHOB|nr:DUF4260 domain-containing protein [Marivita hallyeonensis]SHH94786.1 protein of unknown function [Marivita hallyeonensis]
MQPKPTAPTYSAFVFWQRAEGAVLFGVALWLYTLVGSPFPVWVAVLLFFLPDLSFAAYLLGPRLGAWAYNIVHVYAFGAIVGGIGLAFDSAAWMAAGTLWFAHSGFDRALGYGLKSTHGFKETHLGRIGQE